MRTLGRFFFAMICLCLLLGCASDVVPKGYAASAMKASESCVEFIKKVEGFSAKPYYDYNQHTVGYGTKCPTDKYFDYMVNGIPKDEAELLLQETISDVGEAINQKLIDRYHLALTQYQFDSLISFSFNVGIGWMTYDSTLRNAILRNANENDLVYAFSLYSTAGGNYSSGLINRRLCEANIFLNGVYNHRVSDAYGYVFYEPNGGSLTYQVQGYICENHALPAADAVRREDVFLGWYTDLSGGSQIRELSKDLSGKTLFARWQSSENSDTEDADTMVISVTGDVVNIRNGPGTNYGIASQVYQDHVLIVSHVTELSNRKWGKVENGWICLDYTNYDDLINGSTGSDAERETQPSDETTDPEDSPALNGPQTDIDWDNQDVISGVVRVNDLLRIRSGPGTAYTRVGYLLNGSKVEIMELRTEGSTVWGRISRGWISMDYIITDVHHTDDTVDSDTDQTQETEPAQAPEETIESDGDMEAAAMEGNIIADALRIRSAPGTGHSIVGFYYQDDWVTVSEKVLVNSIYWGKTDRGWINLEYVSTDSVREESTTPADDGTMTVIADCLRVRKSTGTDSRIAALLYYGDTVTILETTTVDGIAWGKIDKGWICMDYVN